MPNDAFFKIPKSKQDKIIRVAFQEFTAMDYDRASISEMVRKLKIAKGSLYDYFGSKKLLYEHLLLLSQQTKRAYTRPLLKDPPESFAEFFVEFQKVQLAFELENPMMAKLLANAHLEVFSQDIGNQRRRLKKMSLDFAQGMIDREIFRGGIRSDIDPVLVSWFLSQCTNSLMDYLIMRYDIGERELKNKRFFLKKVDEDDLSKIFTDLSNLLTHGFKGLTTQAAR